MKFFVILFLLLTISCRDNRKELVVFDEYFAVMHGLDGNSGFNISIYEIDDFKPEVIAGFDKVIISPLLYSNYKDQLSFFSGNLYIMGGYVNDDNINHYVVRDDYSSAYSELVLKLNNNKNFERVAVIIDYDDIKKRDVESLKKIDGDLNIEFLLITKNIGRSSISKFIKDHSSSDLWIVDSKIHGLYAYELIKEGSIVLVEGDDFSSINSNVLYTINTDFNREIERVFSEDSEIIHYELKKH